MQWLRKHFMVNGLLQLMFWLKKKKKKILSRAMKYTIKNTLQMFYLFFFSTEGSYNTTVYALNIQTCMPEQTTDLDQSEQSALFTIQS